MHIKDTQFCIREALTTFQYARTPIYLTLTNMRKMLTNDNSERTLI